MLTKKFALKVKIKTLAVEARFIKIAMGQTKDLSTKYSLRYHHIGVVRKEARHSQLAYAFLRGREYSQVESKCLELPNFKKVEELVERFGQTWDYLIMGSQNSESARKKEQARLFAEWKLRAISHLNLSHHLR